MSQEGGLSRGTSVGRVEMGGEYLWEKCNNLVSPCKDGKKGIRLIVKHKAGLPKVYRMVVNCETKAL